MWAAWCAYCEGNSDSLQKQQALFNSEPSLFTRCFNCWKRERSSTDCVQRLHKCFRVQFTLLIFLTGKIILLITKIKKSSNKEWLTLAWLHPIVNLSSLILYSLCDCISVNMTLYLPIPIKVSLDIQFTCLIEILVNFF